MNETKPSSEPVSGGDRCPKCGARVPANVPEGFCASCLLEAGLLGFHGEAADLTARPPGMSSPLRDFGDYELLEEMGRGGMGVVYKARHKNLNRLVALKMIQAGRLARESDLRRFRTEAEASARLQHPNIVAVHEFGTHDGQHYFTMDFVAGRSLAELAREGPLPARQAATHLQAIASAVQHAHERGVLHRDLKPSNVLLDDAGQPRVTDFGLAKLLESGPELTCSGAVVGSPGYMAPEQAAGKGHAADARSDVYALGAMLYDLLCARPPFQADTALETLHLVQQAEPVPPRWFNPRLPRDLETICLKCLQKEPAKRYATARELAHDLGCFLSDEPIRARPVSRPEKLWRWCRRNRALAASFAGIFLLLVAVAAGSAIAARQFHRTSERALAAERDAKEKLWASCLAQARAGRLSGVMGRRPASLAAIAAAAKMRPSLELRNEAIACLALTDVDPPAAVQPGVPQERLDWSVFDANLERYAVFHARGGVTLRAVQDQRLLAELAAPATGDARGDFSPDGRFLFAEFVGGKVFLWDLQAAQPVAVTNFPSIRDAPRSATFAPDSRTFAVAGKDGFVHFYSLTNEAGVCLESAAPLSIGAAAYRIDYDPSGRRLAVILGGEVQLWDLLQRQRIRSMKRTADGVMVDWHPDGRCLAAGFSNGELGLWDTETGKERLLPGHTQYICALTFDPLGALLVSDSWDSQTRFWDAALGSHLFTGRLGVSCQFSRDGQWLGIRREAGGLDRARVVHSRVFRQLTCPCLRTPNLTGVDLSADGRWLAVGDEAGWGLWDSASMRRLASVSGTCAARLLFHPDGHSVITFNADRVLQWPIEAASSSGEVHVGLAKVVVSEPGSGFQRLSLSADGTTLAVADLGHSSLMDLRNPAQRLRIAPGHAANQLALDVQKRWVAVSAVNGPGITIWDASSGGLQRTLITNEWAELAVSPDGGTLATATVRECRWWDTTTWQVRCRFPLDLAGEVPGCVAFSPAGNYFALAAGRQQVRLYDARSGEEIARLAPPSQENVEPLAFSSDGGLLAGGTRAGIIQLWDLHALRRELAALGLDW